MSALECSTRGDKRFSAFHARVSVGGKLATIEEHYQSSKRFETNQPGSWLRAKGREPDWLEVSGVKLPKDLLSAYYDLLWVKYFDAHPELAAHAARFEEFTDMFKGKSRNCQADTIRAYVRYGRQSIMGRGDVLRLIAALSPERAKNG